MLENISYLSQEEYLQSTFHPIMTKEEKNYLIEKYMEKNIGI